MDSSESLNISRIIADRYELRRSLGRGGFGEVFLAYDRKLDREVALKQLFGSIEDPVFKKQREREMRIHSQLSSKHVISLYDSFTFEGSFYLVFELMQNSLAIYTEPVEWRTVIDWAKDCLRGLQDIHAQGVIHRDIKPANIFIDRQGSIRIGDFGAAQAGASISLPAWTPKYIAPEVILGDQSKVGPSSDLYSLGLVIYQLILGEEGMKKAFREVYEGVDRTEAINNRWLLWQQNSDRKAPAIREFIPEIPKSLTDCVRRLVEKEPTRRFQSAKEALDELYKISESKLQSELLTSGIQTVRRQEKKNEQIKTERKERKTFTPFSFTYLFAGIGIFLIILFLVLSGRKEQPPMPTENLSKSVIIFEKTFHSTCVRTAIATEVTSDRGYLILGTSSPIDSNFYNIYLVKTDESGNKQWERTFGDLKFYSSNIGIVHTCDDGYIVATYAPTGSPDLDKSWSLLLCKTDSYGHRLWERRFDKGNVLCPVAVGSTSDSGFIVLGRTQPSIGYGWGPAFPVLIKTNSQGNKEWERTFKPPRHAYYDMLGGSGVLQTRDGGYIVLEHLQTKVNTFSIYLVKTDPRGKKQWERVLARSPEESANCFNLQQTNDEGYILVGYNRGADTTRYYDVYLLKTDSTGKKEWERNYGGEDTDVGVCARQSSDNGYIVVGRTFSEGKDDDLYIIKVDSSGKLQWERTYGGPKADWGVDIQLTNDRGYIVTGSTESDSTPHSQIYVIKTDSLGNVHK